MGWEKQLRTECSEMPHRNFIGKLLEKTLVEKYNPGSLFIVQYFLASNLERKISQELLPNFTMKRNVPTSFFPSKGHCAKAVIVCLGLGCKPKTGGWYYLPQIGASLQCVSDLGH